MSCIRTGAILLGLLLNCAGAWAEEPVVPFLNGLRSRAYFDTAMQYLDELEARTDLPVTISEVLPLQRGLTLQMVAEQTADPGRRISLLQSAAALLAEFLNTHLDHPQHTIAQTLLSQNQLQQVRWRIQQQEHESPSPEQTALRNEVREQVQSLRDVFIQLRDRFQSHAEQFPVYIPDQEVALRRARNHAQELLIRARLDLAQCDYWEAHTFPVGSAARHELLMKSGAEYESIHQRYRSQVGGLYARLWQGKCYEEMHDDQGIRLALGIYGEILEHDGTSGQLVTLRDLALQFRLVCLNTEFRRDYQLVEMEAEQWLEVAGTRVNSGIGLGIEWELCRSLDFLSQDPQWAPDTRLDMLERARIHAEHLQALPSEYSPAATALLKQIQSKRPPTPE